MQRRYDLISTPSLLSMVIGIVLLLSPLSEVRGQDSLNVRMLGNLSYRHYTDVVVQDGYAYATNEYGVGIIRVSDPENTTLLSFYRTPSMGQTVSPNPKVAVAGEYLYIGTSYSFHIINISDRYHPQLTFSIPIFPSIETPKKLLVHNNHVYFQTYERTRVFQVTNPSSPQLIFQFFTDYSDTPIAIHNNYLYYFYDGLRIRSLANPTQPNLVAWFPVYNALNFTIDNQFLFVVRETIQPTMEFNIYSLLNPISPQLVGTYSTLPFSYDFKLAANHQRLYLVPNSNSLMIFDCSIPATPTLIFNEVTSDYIGSMTIVNDILYQINWGIVIYRIQGVVRPQYIGRYRIPTYARGVVANDSCAFVTDMARGIYSIPLSPPYNDLQVADFFPMISNKGHKIVDTLCFLGGNNSDALVILDISNPNHLQEVGRFEIEWSYQNNGIVRDVEVEGNYAYLAVLPKWLYILDVSNPRDPQYVSSVYVNDSIPNRNVFTQSLALRDHILYVTTGWEGIRAYDVTNPYSPTLIGIHQLNNTYGVATYENFLFVTSYSNVAILNVNDPYQIENVGLFESIGYCDYVSVRYPYLYVSSDDIGLRVVNIRDPSQPQEVGYYLIPQLEFFHTAIVNDSTLISAIDCQVATFDVSLRTTNLRREPNNGYNRTNYGIPKEYSFSQNYPNPFNSETKITYALPRTSLVNLALYDVQGRLVKSLIRGLTQDAGTYTVTIEGNGLASGVYYVKLSAGEFVQARKVVLLR